MSSICKLWLHSEETNAAELIINPKRLPSINLNDVILIKTISDVPETVLLLRAQLIDGDFFRQPDFDVTLFKQSLSHHHVAIYCSSSCR